jgi:hypothetical protein
MFNVLAYVGMGFFGRNGRLSNIGWGPSPCVTRGLFNCGPGLCSAVVRGIRECDTWVEHGIASRTFGDDGIVGRGLGRRSEGSGRHTRDGDVP